MKRKRVLEEQIIGILREHEAGRPTAEVCRKHGISDATFYKWKSKFGGMDVSDAKRLKAKQSRTRMSASDAVDGSSHGAGSATEVVAE